MESSSTIQPPPSDCREPWLHTSVLSLDTNCPHPLLLGPVSLTECGVDHPSLVKVSCIDPLKFYFTHNDTVVDCGNPPVISNGMSQFFATTFGETATYMCNGIFVLSESSTTCMASGLWSTPPICSRESIVFKDLLRLY